jgi:hypothetical protein
MSTIDRITQLIDDIKSRDDERLIRLRETSPDFEVENADCMEEHFTAGVLRGMKIQREKELHALGKLYYTLKLSLEAIRRDALEEEED